jgi:hypothetical protein
MNVTTAWLRPSPRAGGVDHLGIQQTPIRIFSTLLSGLTVVTDRIANYSFYSWVAWAYSQDETPAGLDFIDTLRRSECLLTLIAERHCNTLGDPDLFHSQGLVGRNKLSPALREDAPRPIPLGELAARRSVNPSSYFQHEAGGLGQYYLGPLRELGILQRTATGFEVSESVGVPLAKGFDSRVDRAAFLRVVKRGSVDEAELDSLASFCPCQLAAHGPERELLVDLLFARGGQPAAPPDELRRHTLLLLLDLGGRRGGHDRAPLDLAFRAACLTGALDDGSTWQVPDRWRLVQRAWATYQRNDELSIAVLGVFWATLRLLDKRGRPVQSAAAAGALVAKALKAALGKDAGQPLHVAVVAMERSLPPVQRWGDATHEFQRAFAVESAARAGEVEGCLRAVLDTLLALAVRHRTTSLPRSRSPRPPSRPLAPLLPARHR